MNKERHYDTDAERSCDKVWFTVKQIEEWSKMTNRTLYNRLHKLEEVGRISSLQDFAKTSIPDSLGVLHETTIYNLNVLNQLAMIELDCPILNETAKKFSDILSEVETTGSYGVQLSTDQQLLLKAFEATKDPIAFATVIKERDEYIHKTELKRSMTSMGRCKSMSLKTNS